MQGQKSFTQPEEAQEEGTLKQQISDRLKISKQSRQETQISLISQLSRKVSLLDF